MNSSFTIAAVKFLKVVACKMNISSDWQLENKHEILSEFLEGPCFVIQFPAEFSLLTLSVECHVHMCCYVFTKLFLMIWYLQA